MIYCSFDGAGEPLTDILLPAVPHIGAIITFSNEAGRYTVVNVTYHIDSTLSPATMRANITVRRARR